jgi:hypothetical protein
VAKIFNFFVRSLLILPYRDPQCGAKLFKREALKRVIPLLVMSKWAFDVDLLYNFKKAGYRVLPISTFWEDKEYSKINFLRAGPMMALGVIRLRILNSPMRGFISLYDSIIKRLL